MNETEWETWMGERGRLACATSQSCGVSVRLCHCDRSGTAGNPEQPGPRRCSQGLHTLTDGAQGCAVRSTSPPPSLPLSLSHPGCTHAPVCCVHTGKKAVTAHAPFFSERGQKKKKESWHTRSCFQKSEAEPFKLDSWLLSGTPEGSSASVTVRFLLSETRCAARPKLGKLQQIVLFQLDVRYHGERRALTRLLLQLPLRLEPKPANDALI